MDNKDRFTDIVRKYIKRDGIDKLMYYLAESDFYIAPASTKYHDSENGGLLTHSLNTYDELVKLVKFYDLDVSDESVAIVALFHDLCKIDCYDKSFRNVKKDGVWVQEPCFIWNEKLKYGGHGAKSVFIVNKFIKLTEDEAIAIHNHMGPQGTDFSCMDAYRASPLSFLLHVADMASTIDALHDETAF